MTSVRMIPNPAATALAQSKAYANELGSARAEIEQLRILLATRGVTEEEIAAHLAQYMPAQPAPAPLRAPQVVHVVAAGSRAPAPAAAMAQMPQLAPGGRPPPIPFGQPIQAPDGSTVQLLPNVTRGVAAVAPVAPVAAPVQYALPQQPALPPGAQPAPPPAPVIPSAGPTVRVISAITAAAPSISDRE